MYTLLRSLLFLLPAELSHHLGLAGLKLLYKSGLGKLLAVDVPECPVTLLGLDFPNPVGLAAGLDKNGDYIDALGALGFGFIEVGTITPKAQPGNPKPRLFRLKQEQAIINRMGFNNKGVEHLVQRLKQRRWKGIVGVNIGKNLTTPVEHAADDYLTCLEAVYPYCDYIVVNLSSPNTPGLRSLQFGDHFDSLLDSLKQRQLALAEQHGKYVPLLIKIAPDVTEAEIEAIATSLGKHGIDGVSATNTTIGREGVEASVYRAEAGGLSGKPLTLKSNEVMQCLRKALGPGFPIIGIGGIGCSAEARARHEAGASLLQIYTGFIYQGPDLISRAVTGWQDSGPSL